MTERTECCRNEKKASKRVQKKTVINQQGRKQGGGTTHVVLSLEFAFASFVETPKCLPGGSYLNSFECVGTCYRVRYSEFTRKL